MAKPLPLSKKDFLKVFGVAADKVERNIEKDYVACLALENAMIEQLITSGRLKAEGDAMHHCVGGYSSKVKDGHSFIFRLTIDDKSSTLELNSKYQIVQNRGVSNSQPAFKLDDLAKKLARFLIDKALDGSTEVYSERVMEF